MVHRSSLLIVIGFLFTCAIAIPAEAQDKVVIGIPLAITGIHAKFGEQHHNGYEMALEEILAQGGIRAGGLKGKALQFRVEDDEGKPEKAKCPCCDKEL